MCAAAAFSMTFVLPETRMEMPGVPFRVPSTFLVTRIPFSGSSSFSVSQRDSRNALLAPKLDCFQYRPCLFAILVDAAPASLASLLLIAPEQWAVNRANSFATPLPVVSFPYRAVCASREPVEAPDGAAAILWKPPSLPSSVYFSFNSRVTTGVDDFTTDDFNDFGH